MINDDDPQKPPYTVGYKKPPVATRFKPGQSGNRKGRPPGAKNFTTDLGSELHSRIPAVENGKRKNISKQQAVAKRLVNSAVEGDARAMSDLLNEIRHREAKMNPSEPAIAQASMSPSSEAPSTPEEAAKAYREALRDADPTEG